MLIKKVVIQARYTSKSLSKANGVSPENKNRVRLPWVNHLTHANSELLAHPAFTGELRPRPSILVGDPHCSLECTTRCPH